MATDLTTNFQLTFYNLRFSWPWHLSHVCLQILPTSPRNLFSDLMPEARGAQVPVIETAATFGADRPAGLLPLSEREGSIYVIYLTSDVRSRHSRGRAVNNPQNKSWISRKLKACNIMQEISRLDIWRAGPQGRETWHDVCTPHGHLPICLEGKQNVCNLFACIIDTARDYLYKQVSCQGKSKNDFVFLAALEAESPKVYSPHSERLIEPQFAVPSLGSLRIDTGSDERESSSGLSPKPPPLSKLTSKDWWDTFVEVQKCTPFAQIVIYRLDNKPFTNTHSSMRSSHGALSIHCTLIWY